MNEQNFLYKSKHWKIHLKMNLLTILVQNNDRYAWYQPRNLWISLGKCQWNVSVLKIFTASRSISPGRQSINYSHTHTPNTHTFLTACNTCRPRLCMHIAMQCRERHFLTSERRDSDGYLTSSCLNCSTSNFAVLRLVWENMRSNSGLSDILKSNIFLALK